MPSVKQVVEAFEKNPAETFGRLLCAINEIHERISKIEEWIMALDTENDNDPDKPENWDKEESHLS